MSYVVRGELVQTGLAKSGSWSGTILVVDDSGDELAEGEGRDVDKVIRIGTKGLGG